MHILLRLILLLLLSGSSLALAQPTPPDARTGRRSGRPKLPDPVYRLEAIELAGDFKTSEDIILDALDLELGQTVNVAILREAKVRLLSTGYFQTAQFGLSAGSERGRVVLTITLDERNTTLLKDLFLGVSTRSPFWGGLDLVDTNVFGSGYSARAAFVMGFDQYGYEVGWQDPAVFGSPLAAAITLHYNHGKEPVFPVEARDGLSPNPFTLVTHRAGGRLSFGFYPHPLLGLFFDLRMEWLRGESPRPDLTDTFAPNKDAILTTLAVALELDTRDDPVMPRGGIRANLRMEGAAREVASDFSYFKLIAQLHYALEFVPGHILRFDAVGGAIWGRAPYFERFFVGDFNDLVPARNLDLNFSNRPPVDFFDLGADQLAYENIMMRAAIEYAIPLVERSRFVTWIYRVEFFLGFGVYGATTPEADRAPAILGLEPEPGRRTDFPVDLTLDIGVRMETPIGIFGLSFANGLALIPF